MPPEVISGNRSREGTVRRASRIPRGTALAYLGLGLLWILGTDGYLLFTGNLDLAGFTIQAGKGTAYVAVSALAVYLLARYLPVRRRRLPSLVPAAYLLLGLTWIFASDLYVHGAGNLSSGVLTTQLLMGSAFVILSAFVVFLLAELFKEPADALPARGIESAQETPGWNRYLPLKLSLVFSIVLFGLSRVLDFYGLAEGSAVGAAASGARIVEDLLLTVFAGVTLYLLLRFFVLEALQAVRRETSSRQRHHSLFAHNPSGVCLVDRAGRFQEANPAFCDLFGRPLHDLLGTTFEPLIEPDHLDGIRRQFEAALGGEPRYYEAAIRRPDGERRRLDVANVPRFEDGTVTGVYGVVRDITRERQREEQVAASEARYRALFEQSLDAVFLTRPDGSIEAANSAAQAMLGLSEAEIIERGRDGVVDSSDPSLAGLLEERERTGGTRGVLRYRHADGTTFPAEINSAQFTDADGRLYSFVVARDISERERQQAALRESEARHRAIFEHSMNGMFLLDSEGAILSANPAAREIFRMTEEELQAKGRAGITDASDPAVRRSVEERRRTGQSRAVLRMIRGNGETFPAEINAVQFEAGTGEPLVSVMVRDLTEVRERERQLAASEARLRAVFDHSMDAILLSAPDEGRLLECNTAAERLFGLPEAELKRGHRDQMFDTSDPALTEFIRQRDTTGHARGVLTAIRADGSSVPVEATTSVFEDEHGNRRSSVILRDISESLRREQALRESEDRYRALFENSTDAILIGSPEGRAFDANPAAERLFGLSREELCDLDREDMLNPDDPDFQKLHDKRLRHGRAHAELNLRRGDGTWFLADVTAVGFKNLEGEDRTSIVLRDITESKRQQIALEQSEERLRATVEASLDPIVGMDTEGRIIQFNEAAEGCFGYPADQVLGKPLAEYLMPERFRKAHREGLERYLESGEARVLGKRTEVTGLRADGEEFPAELAINVTKGPSGTIFVGYMRDVTEKRQQEQALRESEERFRSIYEHSPDAILNLDPETGRILTVNAAAERLFGLDKETFTGLERSEHTDVDDPAFQAFLQERKRTGHARATITMFRGDGTGFPADVTSAVFHDSDGRARATAIVRDITEQREREAEVRASEERYRALFEQSMDAIFVTDADTLDLVAANPAAEALFGLTEEKLCARPAEEALDMEDPATRQYFETREREGQARSRLRMKRGDGTWFTAEVTSRVSRNAAGRLMANTVIRDITEQEQYERQLAESEQRFRIVADNTGQVIYEIDLESGDRVWAGACSEMLGYDRNELQTMPARERLMHTPEPERGRVAAQYREAARSGGGFHFEYPLVTGDGREILVEDTGIVLKGIGRMYGVIHDVTEKRRLLRDLESREQALSEVSRVQQAILDALPAHIALLDEDGAIQYVNAAWRRFAEDNDYLSEDAGVGDNYLAVCDATRGRDRETARATARGIRQVMAGERTKFEVEYPCHGLEERRWFLLSVTPFRGGDRIGAVVAHMDISDRREAERQLEMVATAFRSADEAMLICDADFQILDVNHAYERITGRSRDDAIGNRPLFLEIEQQERNIRRALQAEGQWRGELLQKRMDGEVFISRAAVSEVQDPESKSPHLVVNFEDISELRDYENQVDYLSYHDALTGLPNRAALAEWFQGLERKPAENEAFPHLAFAFIDLDRLKTVNDAYGHNVGDELIMELGRRLRSVCKGNDYVARLIGDEFAMVMEGISDGDEALQEVLRRMKTLSAPLKRHEFMIHPTVCAGIALAPEHGTSLEQLLRKADVAMREAKRQGRGEAVLFAASMSDDVEEQLLIERHLRDGIDNQEFLLHYQPSVLLDSGRIIGVEALVRWENPHLGLVPPDRFIPVAEDTGLIIELGDWVFEEVCRQISEWQSNDVPFGWIAVNLSPIQFQDPNLLKKIRECMDRHGVTGDRIRVEITENVLVMDPDWTTSVLESLRALGIRIAVDDFGTGYSSLAYLKRFPVDFVKLDKTFIAGLPEDSADASIVASVVDLARRLGMGVVAEGIERDEQRQFLVNAGCLEAQGYFFSLPLQTADLPWLLTSHQRLPVGKAAGTEIEGEGAGLR